MIANATTIVDIIRWRAFQQPNKVAYKFLVDGDKCELNLTYQELDKKSLAVMETIISKVSPKSRALLIYPPGLDFIVAFCACLYAGIIAVPVSIPRFSRQSNNTRKIQEIISNAECSIVLTTSTLLPNISSKFAQDATFESLKWLATDKISRDYKSLEKLSRVIQISQPNELAFIQYTSGSTGTSKGVMVSHGNIIYNEQVICSKFGHSGESVVMGWLPHYHDMGLIGNIMQPLYIGALCILMSPVMFMKRPILWLKAISRYRATTSGGPNFAYDLCVKKITREQQADIDLSSWDVAFCGAEPIRSETMKQFSSKFASCGFQVNAFYPCYGIAESTLFVSGGNELETPSIKVVDEKALKQNRIAYVNNVNSEGKAIVGCGKSFLGQQIIIVDPETSIISLPNQVGEIWISSKSVAQGYWNLSKETDYAFNAHVFNTGEGPFFRTGDLGFLEDGELFVTGRLKDLIIIRGRNYYPHDIEFTVKQSNSMVFQNLSSAAFTANIGEEERLIVAQEVKRQFIGQLDFESIISDIRKTISLEHGLYVYDLVLLKMGTIPKTSSGKVQRYICRSLFLDGTIETLRINESRVSRAS